MVTRFVTPRLNGSLNDASDVRSLQSDADSEFIVGYGAFPRIQLVRQRRPSLFEYIPVHPAVVQRLSKPRRDRLRRCCGTGASLPPNPTVEHAWLRPVFRGSGGVGLGSRTVRKNLANVVV